MTVNSQRAPVHPKYVAIDMEKTGEKLKMITREKGYDVRDLMTLTGISSTQAIYKWFNGKSIPSIESLIVLSDALDKEITELLVIDGDFHFFACNCWLNDSASGMSYHGYRRGIR